MAHLVAYPFPGNVRELENEVERAATMAGNGKRIGLSHLSDRIRFQTIPTGVGAESQGTLKAMVETLERSVLLQTLEKHGNNKTRAARELGLSRYGLLKKVQRYGL